MLNPRRFYRGERFGLFDTRSPGVILDRSGCDLLNAMREEILRLGLLRGVDPVLVTEEAGGRKLELNRRPAIFAQLTGAGNPYSFQEVYWNGTAWASITDGHSDMNAYEANGVSGLGSTVQRLELSQVDDWRFQIGGLGGTPPPACGQICVAISTCVSTGTPGATVTLKDPSGAVIGTATADSAIASILVGTHGSGYTSTPAVTIEGGGGTGATAVAVLSGGTVGSITVTNGGTGYYANPTVVIDAPPSGGTQALASATSSSKVCFNYYTTGVHTITASGGVLSIPTSTTTVNATTCSGATFNGFISGITPTLTGVAFNPHSVCRGGGDSVFEATTVTVTQEGATVGSGTTSGPNWDSTHSVQTWAVTMSLPCVGFQVSSITITAGGTGYTSPPTVSFSGGGGSGAAGTANLTTAGVASVAVTAGGTGYTSAPTVTFSGGGGFSAAATATIAGGAVTAVTVTSAGFGYSSPPTVGFTGGGGGTGAAGTASLPGRGVGSVTLTSGGHNYTSAPTVSFSGGGGSGATGTAVMFNEGAFLQWTSSHPRLVFPTGSFNANCCTNTAQAQVATGPASGYHCLANLAGGNPGSCDLPVADTLHLTNVSTGSCTLTYNASPPGWWGGGPAWFGNTTMDYPGLVTNASVTTGGGGYTSVPTVSFTGGGGTGAAATVTIGGGAITSITVTNPGTGYTSAPTINFTGGGGSGAHATAGVCVKTLGVRVDYVLQPSGAFTAFWSLDSTSGNCVYTSGAINCNDHTASISLTQISQTCVEAGSLADQFVTSATGTPGIWPTPFYNGDLCTITE